MSLRIEYRPGVYKQLKKIPKVEQRKIMRKLEILAADPYSGKLLQGEYERFSSLQAWPYRIIYEVKKDSILVYSIKHRQGVYK